MIREAKRKAATLENFQEAMERTGGETGAQRKKVKTSGEGGGGEHNATKLHRLLDMFKVGADIVAVDLVVAVVAAFFLLFAIFISRRFVLLRISSCRCSTPVVF